MSDVKELKPCPFCNGPADFKGREIAGYTVECKHCGAQSGWGDYGFQVEDKWNRRAALSGTREAVEPVGDAPKARRLAEMAMDFLHHDADPDTYDRHVAELTKKFARLTRGPADPAAPPSDPVGQGAVTDLAKRLRAATMRFDWTDIPDDEPVPAIPLLREAANVLSSLSPAPEAGSDEVERLRAERDSLLKSHRLLNVSGAKLQDRAEAAEARETALRDQLGKMREALRLMIYETTHLSPEEDDGSHWCKISKDALSAARATLAETQEAGR